MKKNSNSWAKLISRYWLRRIYSNIVKILFILMIGTTGSTTLFAKTLDVGPRANTYSGNVRGFWFTYF